jgi:hypothetical protein
MSAAEERRRARRLGRFGTGRAENLLGGEAGSRRSGPSRQDLILAGGDELADELDLEQFTIKVWRLALPDRQMYGAGIRAPFASNSLKQAWVCAGVDCGCESTTIASCRRAPASDWRRATSG